MMCKYVLQKCDVTWIMTKLKIEIVPIKNLYITLLYILLHWNFGRSSKTCTHGQPCRRVSQGQPLLYQTVKYQVMSVTLYQVCQVNTRFCLSPYIKCVKLTPGSVCHLTLCQVNTRFCHLILSASS